jgi:hypothetical protein
MGLIVQPEFERRGPPRGRRKGNMLRGIGLPGKIRIGISKTIVPFQPSDSGRMYIQSGSDTGTDSVIGHILKNRFSYQDGIAAIYTAEAVGKYEVVDIIIITTQFIIDIWSVISISKIDFISMFRFEVEVSQFVGI